MTTERTPHKSPDRRSFLLAAGAIAVSSAAPTSTAAPVTSRDSNSSPTELVTGNGEWTYRVTPGWGRLPSGTTFGGTHGGIAQDSTGHLYISTQSQTGILVYTPDGAYVRSIATQYPEVHSIVYAREGGDDYLYTTIQKGTPDENWLFVKMKTDGSVVRKITAPSEAGFAAPNAWRLTAALPTPEGELFIANGYGDSRLFRYDKAGNYKTAYSGKGAAEGQLNCSHGLALDTRYDQPLLLVCDRENRRLCHFDLDGKYVRTVTEHLRRPCQVSFYGDYAIASELEGRLTILDRDNAPVAFLGDNPHRAQWANYDLDPSSIVLATFSAAHGCFIDRDANIYVSDWNKTGRITRLSRLTT
jgi:hypothetical protein